MSELSEFQQKTKAKTIARNLQLAQDLANLDGVIKKIFDDAPPDVRAAVSKDEVKTLLAAVAKGTADNIKTARFLELAGKLGLG